MSVVSKQKGTLKQIIQYTQNNSLSVFVALGFAIAGFVLGYKIYNNKGHPDIRKVLQLREKIEKSYPIALKSLQTLKIEKRVRTSYGSLNEQSQISDQLDMQFLVITRLKLKEKNKQTELRNPFLPPFEQGLFISQMQPSHRLLYNKFNIFRNHLLVITKQYQAQSNDINESDFKQSILVLKALNGLLFFNSGPAAGSSQPHKHIQLFPRQALDLPIIKRIVGYVNSQSIKYNYEEQQIIQFPAFNFVHGIILLKPHTSLNQSKKEMHSAYKKILQQRIRKIQAAAYNVLATQEFIFLVGRKKQKAFDEIAINSVGFMGSLLFKDQQRLNRYLTFKIKPSTILENITYPKNYTVSQNSQQQKKIEN